MDESITHIILNILLNYGKNEKYKWKVLTLVIDIYMIHKEVLFTL